MNMKSSSFDLANSIGIDEVRIKTAQLYDYKNGNRLMPLKNTQDIRQKDGTYRLKGRQGNHCWRMWSGLYWGWRSCTMLLDKDATHTLGSIKETSFKEFD